ncbi:hypothetical protein F8271_31985, partial [Micromonospora sp. ALFpr18c]
NGEQTANVKAIIAATKKAGLPERAAVISIATSLQESKLENLGRACREICVTEYVEFPLRPVESG